MSLGDTERMLIERACARLVTEYCHFVDHGQAARIADLFTEDGVWSSPENAMTGRAEVARGFAARERNKRRMSRHVCNNLLIDVIDETTASGVVYLTLYRHDGEEGRSVSPVGPPALLGEYRDQFEKTPAGWRFKRREFHVNFTQPRDQVRMANSEMTADQSAEGLQGRLTEAEIPTSLAPEPVKVITYTPPGYDPSRAEAYPLLVQLHGGGGSEQNLRRMAPLLERAILDGLVPPMVSIMPGAARSFYMDFRDGSQRWETFVITALLDYVRSHFHVVRTREGSFITGISMGGMGSLRITFKHPELFQGVASQEPGIEPALSFDEIKLRDRFWRSDALFRQIYGDPVDQSYWAANNPANILVSDPSRILGLAIYLEAGDQDMFYLHQGTEFLHRLLFDAGVSHEYRLVRGAEHVGPSIEPRFRDALAFIGRVLRPPQWLDDTTEATRRRLDGLKEGVGYPLSPVDPRRVRSS